MAARRPTKGGRGTRWSYDESQKLVRLHKELNGDWEAMATHFENPGRTVLALKNQFHRAKTLAVFEEIDKTAPSIGNGLAQVGGGLPPVIPPISQATPMALVQARGSLEVKDVAPATAFPNAAQYVKREEVTTSSVEPDDVSLVSGPIFEPFILESDKSFCIFWHVSPTTSYTTTIVDNLQYGKLLKI